MREHPNATLNRTQLTAMDGEDITYFRSFGHDDDVQRIAGMRFDHIDVKDERISEYVRAHLRARMRTADQRRAEARQTITAARSASQP